MRGDIQSVIDYYVARTCYFFCSYSPHELVVKELEFSSSKSLHPNIKKTKLSRRQTTAIEEADAKAQALISKFGVNCDFANNIKDWIRGRIATQEYGLQNYFLNDENRATLQETAMLSQTKGVVNSAFSSEEGQRIALSSLIKVMRRKMNTEGRVGGLTKDRLALWAFVKFHTEFKTILMIYQTLSTIPPDMPQTARLYFEEYCRNTVDFVLRHIEAAMQVTVPQFP